MSDLQSTVDFAVELFKFYNVDLFQRGIYQVRCSLRVSTKLRVEIEVSAPELGAGLSRAIIIGSYGSTHPFQILYRNEEVSLKNTIIFHCRIAFNGQNIKDALQRIEFSLLLELWFSNSSNIPLTMVSSRTLQLHLSPITGLHYHLPVLFDYFHLSAISVTIHAALITIHPSTIKKGIFRYIQSCTPKPSKPGNKINLVASDTFHLNDKIHWKINESSKIHLQAYEILKEAHCHLKRVTQKYTNLLIDGIYDNSLLEVEYKSKMEEKRRSTRNEFTSIMTVCLKELCIENMKLWDHLLINLGHKTLIQQHLSKKHHAFRMERFSEFFFLTCNTRYSAMECSDYNYQKYIVTAELLRRSKYLTTLPSLPVHCTALDGDPLTIPIIFEDRYQNICDYDLNLFEYGNLYKTGYYRENILKPSEHSTHVNVVQPLLKCYHQMNEYITSTRHSRSLDHLQYFSAVDFQKPFVDTKYFSQIQNKMEKAESMQNINLKLSYCKYPSVNVKNLSEKTKKKWRGKEIDFVNTKPKKFLKTYLRKVGDNQMMKKRKRNEIENFKPFIIKNFENVKQHCQKLVKSISHNVTSESTRHIFQSSSMELNSLRQSFTAYNKLNSCYENCEKKEQCNNVLDLEQEKSERYILNGKYIIRNEDITSSDNNSVNNISLRNEKVLYDIVPFNLLEYKRSQSAPCLIEEKSIDLLRYESLPDLTTKIDDYSYYEDITYYSDTSSSEKSEGVTSESEYLSSSDSSSLSCFVLSRATNGKYEKWATSERKKYSRSIADSRSKKKILPLEGIHNKTRSEEQLPLPPPQQFRDADSPSLANVPLNSEIRDVSDVTATIIKNKAVTEYDVSWHYEGLKSNIPFVKVKNEFKGQLNFPGILYSDLNVLKSSIPYFHISDDFRMFSPQGMHLIICVHGLDGNSADLRLVRTYLELGLPGAYLDFLMSERNQGDTFSDFDTMTDRLISEILHYLETCTTCPTRISFVGHSLGNIIIRSALTRPEMKFILSRLHTFLSLSGPHLGTLYNNSGLVNMGMWFMQKWKKSGSLLQLCLKDASDYRNSFIYRLSQKGTLNHFKNILLCGSGQDRYVPLHSARIELCKDAVNDTSELGAVYREMVHNILCPVLADDTINFIRYDVHHALPNTANALIGRAAHIAVLDSELFIEKFMAIAGIKYFR